jgi:hypothetical protein
VFYLLREQNNYTHRASKRVSGCTQIKNDNARILYACQFMKWRRRHRSRAVSFTENQRTRERASLAGWLASLPHGPAAFYFAKKRNRWLKGKGLSRTLCLRRLPDH